MAFPSYTYTFSNGTTADASQVNQNFSDILNGVSDGTKDISIAALTVAGTSNLKSAVILGASGSNDLTFNGSVASSIAVKTNTSFDFGSATLGLRSVYIGGTSTFTTRLLGAATATWTLTLPTTAGTGGQFLQTDGSGVTSWANVSEPKLVTNLGLAASVATNALTISLKTAGGSDPSSSSPVAVAFRNATSATGQYSIVSQTAALSITVPSSATLGQTSNVNQYVWVYLINDAGTLDLAVSGITPFDENTTQSSTQISSSATSGSTLYGSVSHSGAKAIRLIGRLLVNEATAGTWASAPSELSLMPTPIKASSEWTSTTNAFTSSGTANAKASSPTTDKFWSRRNGANLEFRIEYSHSSNTGAITGTGEFFFGIASGQNIDSTRVQFNTAAGSAVSYAAHSNVGHFEVIAGASSDVGFLMPYDATRLRVVLNGNRVIGQANTSVLGLASANILMQAFGSVPIAGWSEFGP